MWYSIGWVAVAPAAVADDCVVCNVAFVVRSLSSVAFAGVVAYVAFDECSDVVAPLDVAKETETTMRANSVIMRDFRQSALTS